MARGMVYRLPDGGLAVDCQANTISGFGTRFMIPLVPPGSINRPIPRLMPLFTILGERVVLATPFGGAVPERLLGQPVATLADDDHAVTDAIDMLLSGY